MLATGGIAGAHLHAAQRQVAIGVDKHPAIDCQCFSIVLRRRAVIDILDDVPPCDIPPNSDIAAAGEINSACGGFGLQLRQLLLERFNLGLQVVGHNRLANGCDNSWTHTCFSET